MIIQIKIFINLNLIMSIQVFLRANIRGETWNETNWYLFSIFKRYQKKFKLGKKSIEFYIEKNKLCSQLSNFEIMKYNSRLSRDILILVFLKRNPFYQKLWIQLLLDKVFLEEKLEVLRSALFFYPRNRFFLECISLTIGLDTISQNEPHLNSKNFFLSAIISIQNGKNLIEIMRFFRFISIITRIIHIFPINLKKTFEIGNLKNISMGAFQDILLIYNEFKVIQKDNNIQKPSFKLNNLIDLVKLKYLKFIKIQKKNDLDVLLSLSNFYKLFFKKEISSILRYNKRWFMSSGKKKKLSDDKSLSTSEFFGLFFKCSVYKLKSDFLKKDFCTRFFHKKLKPKTLLFFKKKISLKILKNYFHKNNQDFLIRFPNFIFPINSKIGLFEKKKSNSIKNTEIREFTYFSYTNLIQINLNLNNFISSFIFFK